ncbi:[protein-PII] uridylyltransferase [Planctomycetes bacterium K23_9]|uniref:Bifunctional uridylyltransferase/uridylyl-removing enzyme n=1 Tax=Stieleria marina TaxID=1930275 RepID=A0A517NNP7_9BACT|nr:Bifunctional uridylyltransferase/uridylyl-removing enzyme [Planctomycetes bacterium K23_9]
MSNNASLREIVLESRERLQVGREKAKQQHNSGSAGFQVATRLADLYDDIVLSVWAHACKEHQVESEPKGIALVAHGGFGRRDIAPYSDADLMMLVTPSSSALAGKIAGTLTRDLVDAGLQVGFSLRTADEATGMAWEDAVIFSSLTESRLLAGSLQLYSKFFHSLRQGALRRSNKLIRDVVAARREERRKWGETNFLLSPNVKRSRGALRDIQLVRWIGFARYGEVDLERLLKLGALPEEDYRLLRKAYAFMLRLRHELHFREGRAQDVLDRPTQLEIAEAWGYTADAGMLPVEVLMQDYFDNTRNVRYAAAFFRDDSRSQPLVQQALERIWSRSAGDGIRIGPSHIWVQRNSLDEFSKDLPRIMRLMSMANLKRKRIGHRTWQAIRKSMQEREPQMPGAETVGAFMSLISHPGRLGDVLRRLHELRIIEQLIPEFKRTRGLLQFNAYHKYTVDAHCIRSVEAAAELEESQTSMGRRYRRIRDKTLLHLALLIHDIGKGYEEDHCIVGARIAVDVAKRLELDSASSEFLEWLIRQHLLVNTIAFRHNLDDPEIILSFAKEVGSIRRLELLVVHAVADLTAVGPDVINDWKLNLIEKLYLQTRRYFEKGQLPGENDERLSQIREDVGKIMRREGANENAMQILEQFPGSLMRQGDLSQVASRLVDVGKAFQDGKQSLCSGEYDSEISAMCYRVVYREDQRIGTFARVTGALATCGLAILRADVETVGENLVWDCFWVVDPDYAEEAPEFRIKQVCDRVCKILDSPDAPLPPYRKTWRTSAKESSKTVHVLPTNVVFDNATVDRFTILSLFAYDQVGLLHRIAVALADLRIVLHFAKIDTHLDQIADVFYVTEEDGSLIDDVSRQEAVRDKLIQVVDENEED